MVAFGSKESEFPLIRETLPVLGTEEDALDTQKSDDGDYFVAANEINGGEKDLGKRRFEG